MIIVNNKSSYLFAFFAGLFICTIGVAVFTELYYLVAIPFLGLLFYAGWQNKNVVFFLLLATIPFSVEYNFSSGLGTDLPDEILMLLVSLLFIAYFLYTPQTINKNVLQHPLLLFLFIVIAWMMVTVIFSSRLQISVKYGLAKGWYIAAFVLAPLIVFRQKKTIIIAGKVIAGSMMLVVAIALFRHYSNGFSFATINNAVTPFFRNHVNYSAMLVCVVPVLVAFFRLTKKREHKLLLTVAIIIALVALFFTYSRGAWLALLVGMIAYWLIKKRGLFFSYLVAMILTIGFIFWMKGNDRYLQYTHDYKTTIFHKDFSEHLIATYKFKDVSTAERFYRWIAGVRMIKDNWLTGYGPNTFYDNYRGYAVPAFKTWVSDNPEHSTVHNYFLLTTIEQGIPGLVFLLLLLGAMFYYTQNLYHRVKDPFYRTVAATVGVILTMITILNFLSDLIETDKIGSLFFLCISLLVVTDINSRGESDLAPDIQRIS